MKTYHKRIVADSPFGHVVHAKRVELGITLSDFSEKIGFNLSGLCAIERYGKNPGNLVPVFAEHLNLNEDYLWYLACAWPTDILEKELDEKTFAKGIAAFRKATLKG